MAFNSISDIEAEDIFAMDDEDFEALRFKVIVDKERRDALAAIPQSIAQSAAHFRSIGGDEDVLLASISLSGEASGSAEI